MTKQLNIKSLDKKWVSNKNPKKIYRNDWKKFVWQRMIGLNRSKKEKIV